MKLFFYLAVINALAWKQFSAAENVDEYAGAGVISIDEIIEKVRDAIPEVITIPTLDVYLADNQYLTGYLNVSNVTLTGIKEFNMTVTVNIFKPSTFLLKVDVINLFLGYFTNLTLLNIPLLSIFGHGDGSVALDNFIVQGNIAVDLFSDPVNISINSLKMSLEDTLFGIHGLLDDDTFSDQVNNFLNANVANLFNEYGNVFSPVLEDLLNTLIGGILKSNSTLSSIDDQILLDLGGYREAGEGFLEVFDALFENIQAFLV